MLDPSAVVTDIEIVASHSADDYPMAIKAAWDLGARLYERLENQEGRRRCQLGSVDQLLAMRKQVSTASAEAHWVMEALQALRHVKDVEQLEAQLEDELRSLQRRSTKNMAAFSIDLDLKQDAENVTEYFKKVSIHEALFGFAFLDQSRPIDELKKEALATQNDSPLAAMMSASHVDDQGRAIRHRSGADVGEEPSEGWFLRTIGQAESLRRVVVVGGKIEPARTVIHQRFAIDERHIWPIVGHCPFVPPNQQAVLVLGFVRFFQGDHISAAHLLIPQYEACLRHILKLNGHEPTRRFDDGTEEEFDLAKMFTHLKAELAKILTPDIEDELERLMHLKPGPALRHTISHGHLTAAECYGADVVYANWLLYRLCCLFVRQQWKLIAPLIGA